jgi:hypothetical protein
VAVSVTVALRPEEVAFVTERALVGGDGKRPRD